MLLDFFTGMLIGFMIAVPIGPIDMLCIRKTLLYGARAGFITGLGAACADAIYGAAAAFGMITLTSTLISYKLPFQVAGGIFLCGLGLRTWHLKADREESEVSRSKQTFAFLTSFLLVLLSPLTILSFIGAFAVMGLGYERADFYDALVLTAGVFSGSTLWWLILSSCAALCKNKMELKSLYWLTRISGIVIFVFGVGAIGHAVWMY